jgi:anhydro-N-acetylmuramic acid kinase
MIPNSRDGSGPCVKRGGVGARLAPATVETADQAGWSSDAFEAQAFAYLAVRTLNNLPITFPKTTGAPKPLTGGAVAQA